MELDFPLETSIRLRLPICDEVVVNVGKPEDDTLALVRSIRDPKIRIIETEWDMTIKNKVLGDETLRAMRACLHPAVAERWVEGRQPNPERRVEPANFKPEHLRSYASDVIECLTGTRVFEFRNYKLR